MPPKVFTFMSHKGVHFSGTNTPLNTYMLEVAQAVRDDDDNSGSANSANADQPDSSEHSTSVHTPTPPIVSPQHDDLSERTPSVSVSLEKPISAEGTSPQSTSSKGTASEHTPVPSPNDYTSTGGL